MTKTADPNPESVLARLRNLARASYPNLPLNLMLTLYAQQGLLARLEASHYREQFVLKGALSLFARYRQMARPTEDIDLAAHDLPNTVPTVVAVFEDLCVEPYSDGLVFEPTTITARVINEMLEYPGVSLLIRATLGRSRVALQLDVSFGNAITPEPTSITFPALLIDDPVRVRVYPLETVIAEKFAALVEIGEATTRMKDLYDLYTILERETFQSRLMRLAFERSFTARQTPRGDVTTILSADFASSSDLTRRWRQYRTRTGLIAPELPIVMDRIRAFCALLLVGPELVERHWDHDGGWVEEPSPKVSR